MCKRRQEDSVKKMYGSVKKLDSQGNVIFT